MSPDHDYSDRTAGAIVDAAQIPLATISGWVYHDRNDDGTFQHDGEQGIGGVTLELLDAQWQRHWNHHDDLNQSGHARFL